MTRADMIAYLEGYGFECLVHQKPNTKMVKDELCAMKQVNGVPVSFIGDLPSDPTADHNGYAFNIWHYVMMAIAQHYGYGRA